MNRNRYGLRQEQLDAVEAYGVSQEELDADLAALEAAEARHVVSTMIVHGQHAAARAAGREGIVTTTSAGLRVPQGFEARRTLGAGDELVCCKCGWTASLAPSGQQGFTVEVMDRGPCAFKTREAAASAVWLSAVQHGESCKA